MWLYTVVMTNNDVSKKNQSKKEPILAKIANKHEKLYKYITNNNLNEMPAILQWELL